MNLVEVQLWDTAGVNVALRGAAVASSTHPTGAPQFQASNLIDGWWDQYTLDASVFGPYDMWHTGDYDASPWVQITLPADAAITRVVVVSRNDCCETRDVGDVVSLLDAVGGVRWTTVIDGFTLTAPPVGSSATQLVPVWAANVSRASSSCTRSSSPTRTPTGDTGSGVSANAIRISHNYGIMNLVEVQLWDTAGVNVALGGFAFASSARRDVGGAGFPPQFQASNLIDGWWGTYAAYPSSGYDIWESDNFDAFPWVQITLPADAAIRRVVVVSRDDGLDWRDVGDEVSLLDAAGGVQWTAVINGFTLTVPPAGSTSAQRVPVWVAAVSPPSATSSLPRASSEPRVASTRRFLDAGSIAGFVLGAFALAGLLAAGAYLLLRRRAKYRTGLGLPQPALDPRHVQRAAAAGGTPTATADPHWIERLRPYAMVRRPS